MASTHLEMLVELTVFPSDGLASLFDQAQSNY